MFRRAISLAAVSALVLTALAVSGTTATAAMQIADKDCSDFATQKAAQEFFLDHGGPQSDPHNLDADSDGVACESNPCPCSTSQGGGGDHGGDSNGPSKPPLVVQRAKIVRVIDGDTMLVDLANGPNARVRLLGIDTPEVFGGKECWGPQASRLAKKILPRGTRVVLRSDRSQPLKDRYHRLLRYLQVQKYDISKVQLLLGNARVLVVGKRFQRYGAYKRAAKVARQQRRGLWKHC